jgi:nitrate/TMAO reductase-like tetraheme cytochrome c subunit
MRMFGAVSGDPSFSHPTSTMATLPCLSHMRIPSSQTCQSCHSTHEMVQRNRSCATGSSLEQGLRNDHQTVDSPQPQTQATQYETSPVTASPVL